MRVDPRAILILAHRELRETLRRRSIWAYAIALTALALALSVAGVRTAGYSGLGGFGRTSASLVNALLFFVPLLALSAGAASQLVDRERGSLAYLMAQPITRADLFWGKTLGALTALLSVLLGAFIITIVVITASGGADAGPMLALLGYATLYAITCLAIGIAVGSLAKTQAAATGVTITLWLAFAFLGDAAFLLTALALHPTSGTLLSILLANPAQAYRLGAMHGMQGDLSDIGPLGAFADHELGAFAAILPAVVLLTWTLAAGALAYATTMRRRAA